MAVTTGQVWVVMNSSVHIHLHWDLFHKEFDLIFLLVWLFYQCLNQVIIFQMSRQLSCRDMCKATAGLPYNHFSRKNLASLQWRHSGHNSVSNHQPHDCLLNRLFRRRSKKTSKLRVTGLCVGNSPGTGEFAAQMASNSENVSIWWRHHVVLHNSWAHKLFVKWVTGDTCVGELGLYFINKFCT